jgi:UDP-N-acetylglucosamine--N-acetylmuramyl-(pentapeptide) pyrophosphoryl-undecaprenol N-acetylglucosamine transferase
MEARIVQGAGYTLYELPVTGFYRQLSLRNILRNLAFPFNLIRSRIEAHRLIRRFSPDWVIGFGGYASYPAVRAGMALGCRTAIMEQNAWPGLANRKLAPGVDVAFLGSEAVAPHLPARLHLYTGNPVRPSIGTSSRSEARMHLGVPDDAFVLLVLGGSLGARAINDTLEACWPELIDRNLTVLWQCGQQYHEELTRRIPQHPQLHLVPYIERMDWAMAAADLAVSRAGALTLAELQQATVPAVLVPSPNVAEDHQTKNATAYSLKGGALVIPQSELSSRFTSSIFDLVDNPSQLQCMRNHLDRLPRQDAAGRIAEYILAYE